MKKTVSFLAAGLLLAGVASAQTKTKPAETPKELACPIMSSHKVNIVAATKSKMFADYKGRRYFFCCAGCPGQFKANPAKFAKMPSIPTPKK